MNFIVRAFRAPHRGMHLLAIVIGMFLAQWAAQVVLVRNQENRVYPSDGDSIGIPMIGLLSYHLLVLLLLLIAMAVIRAGVIGRVLGYSLLALSSLGYLVQILDWGDPNHYPIGLAQGVVGVQLLAYLFLEYRRWTGTAGRQR